MLRIVSRFNTFKRPLLQSCRFLSDNAKAKASRELRIKGGRKGASTSGPKSGGSGYKLATGIAAVAVAVGAAWEIKRDGGSQYLKDLYRGSQLETLIAWIYEHTVGAFEDVMMPVSDKLLPDWPTAPCYGNPIPGTPAPPVLVIDLERTLIGSIHDSKHGWRHVKRPGADKFLEALSNYYEIVIFSEQDKGMVYEVFEALDKNGSCHKFGSAEGEIRNSQTLKRIDVMNRDPARILYIDDNPEAVQLCSRNALIVKPFVDVYDTKDRTLLDLIPLLQAFVHEGVQDFRTTLDSMGTHDAEEAIHEYELRLAKKKMHEDSKRNAGLGGFVRAKLVSPSSASSLVSTTGANTSKSATAKDNTDDDLDDDDAMEKSKKVSQSSTKASAPPPPPAATKKKGLLFQLLDDSERMKEEAEMKKREKMNEIYTQRLREKAEKEAQLKAKSDRDRD